MKYEQPQKSTKLTGLHYLMRGYEEVMLEKESYISGHEFEIDDFLLSNEPKRAESAIEILKRGYSEL